MSTDTTKSTSEGTTKPATDENAFVLATITTNGNNTTTEALKNKKKTLQRKAVRRNLRRAKGGEIDRGARLIEEHCVKAAAHQAKQEVEWEEQGAFRAKPTMISNKENTVTPLTKTTDTALTEIAGPGNKKKLRQGGKVATRVRAAKRDRQIGDLEIMLQKQLDDDDKDRKKEADERKAAAAFRGESDKARIRKLERENNDISREKEWLQESFLTVLDLTGKMNERIRELELDNENIQCDVELAHRDYENLTRLYEEVVGDLNGALDDAVDRTRELEDEVQDLKRQLAAKSANDE